jgi:alpha-L-rhamnosidase
MCGINIAGENKFVISPKPGGNITHAKAAYDSIYGKVVSGWKIVDGKIVFTVEIPANTTALFVANSKSLSLAAGSHTIETNI